jgi:hypothetical protein
MHLGILPRHEFSIHPDEAFALIKGNDGHGISPLWAASALLK